MEEIHAAAEAYYNHGTLDQKERAMDFFRAMDTNRDGRINCSEFTEFLRQRGYTIGDPNLFASLDRNGDGGLDFKEALTFFYIVRTRSMWCQGCECGVYLCGLYFTCVTCFDGVVYDPRLPSYDLCPACYASSNFHHRHSNFLDNHMLLRSKRGLLLPNVPPNLHLAITNPVPQSTPPVYIHNYNVWHPHPPERNRWSSLFEAFNLFEIALATASVATAFSNCAIM